jgi:hypothetical protein
MRRHVLATLLIGAIAVSVTGCSKDPTSPLDNIDLSPPAAPGNLEATSDPATGREWLDWDPSASLNVASYEVYVSDTPGGSGTIVATVDGASSDFLLPGTIETVTEYYRVRAIGTNAVPSAFSSTVSVNRDGWDGVRPNQGPDKGSEGAN